MEPAGVWKVLHGAHTQMRSLTGLPEGGPFQSGLLKGMSSVFLNRSRIPSSPGLFALHLEGSLVNVAFRARASGPREDLTESQNVGTEIPVVDVCGFLAGPCSFTPFPVTTSNVCGGATLPHLQSRGFHGTDSTSLPPTLPVPGTLCDQAWHGIQSISFPVVQGQTHHSREANQSQSVSLWGFAWAPGCALRSRFQLWRLPAGAGAAISPTCTVWK